MAKARVVLRSVVVALSKGMNVSFPSWRVFNPKAEIPGINPNQLESSINIKRVVTKGKNLLVFIPPVASHSPIQVSTIASWMTWKRPGISFNFLSPRKATIRMAAIIIYVVINELVIGSGPRLVTISGFIDTSIRNKKRHGGC